MVALPTLYPIPPDGTSTTMAAPVGATTHADAMRVDDGDTSYSTSGVDSAGSIFVNLDDTPNDFGTMNTVQTSCVVRLNGTRTDDITELYAQIFAADETTALTVESLVTDHTTGNTYTVDTTSMGLTSQGLNGDKVLWDGAKLRLRWVYTKSKASDGIALRVTQAYLTGDYGAITPTVTGAVAMSASSTVAAAGTLGVPDAPTGLAASDIKQHGITLTWTDINNANTYEVETGGVITHTSLPQPAMRSTRLTPSTTYSYRVRGKNADGVAGPWSAILSATSAAPLSATLLSTLEDNFASGVIDTKWATVGNVSVVDGSARLTVNGTATQSELNPAANYTIDTLSAEFVPASTTMIKLAIEVRPPVWTVGGVTYQDVPGASIYIQHNTGELIAEVFDDEMALMQPSDSVIYDSAAHRFLRVRHDGTTFFMEYSADAVTWTSMMTTIDGPRIQDNSPVRIYAQYSAAESYLDVDYINLAPGDIPVTGTVTMSGSSTLSAYPFTPIDQLQVTHFFNEGFIGGRTGVVTEPPPSGTTVTGAAASSASSTASITGTVTTTGTAAMEATGSQLNVFFAQKFGLVASSATGTLAATATATTTGVSTQSASSTLAATASTAATGTIAMSASATMAASSGDTLATPTNVVAVADSPTQVTVTWDIVSGAEVYDVERGGTIVDRVTTTSYTDVGLSPQTTYTYRVRAVKFVVA